MSTENLDPEEEAASSELFDLVHRVRAGLRACTQTPSPDQSAAKYLWVHFDALPSGSSGAAGSETASPPTLEQWLNVVDEAASLGVQWIVLSLDPEKVAFSDIIRVCEWAQQTHGMTIGLHTEHAEVILRERDTLQALDPEKTQILAKAKTVEELRASGQIPFALLVADPQPYGEKPECEGPTQLLFVNSCGRVYTCGLVEDKPEYALGTIFSRTFSELLSDPELPHRVQPHQHIVGDGCDGCPSLLASLLGGCRGKNAGGASPTA